MNRWAILSRPAGTKTGFREFTIAWQVSKDGGATWTSAGRSRNEMFVTLATPLATPYITLCHDAAAGAQGAKDEEKAIADVWKLFEGGKKVNKAGEPLHYYKSWITTNTSTQALLKDKEGAVSQLRQLCGFFDGGNARFQFTPHLGFI